MFHSDELPRHTGFINRGANQLAPFVPMDSFTAVDCATNPNCTHGHDQLVTPATVPLMTIDTNQLSDSSGHFVLSFSAPVAQVQSQGQATAIQADRLPTSTCSMLCANLSTISTTMEQQLRLSGVLSSSETEFMCISNGQHDGGPDVSIPISGRVIQSEFGHCIVPIVSYAKPISLNPSLSNQPYYSFDQYTSCQELGSVNPMLSGSSANSDPPVTTQELARMLRAELRQCKIPQAVFAHHVLCRSQGTLSDLLHKPKPWAELRSGRETYRRMWRWLQQPRQQRLQHLRSCEEESEDASATNPTVPPADTAVSGRRNSRPRQHRQQRRPSFTDVQRRTLAAVFAQTQRPSRQVQASIAAQTGLSVATVSNYFFNSRRRYSMDRVWTMRRQHDDTQLPAAAATHAAGVEFSASSPASVPSDESASAAHGAL